MRYTPFSQRYGYIKPENIIIRESLTGHVLNSVINGYERFRSLLSMTGNGIVDNSDYNFMIQEFNLFYLNRSCYEEYCDPINLLKTEENSWFTRIDIIEWIIQHFRNVIDKKREFGIIENHIQESLDWFISFLNSEFTRHNYAYRIINDIFVETTSPSEIETINEAFEKSDSSVVTHLNECLKLLSPSNPDISTRNAIKEAISAVEVKARQITNTSTLDRALKKLGDIHPMIKESISKLYYYTNSENPGIRHGWMEQEKEPTKDEAIFILVTSCVFINYLTKIYN